MNKDNDIKYNGSGYYDITAYEAIMSIDEEEIAKKRLIKTIRYICELAGFEIENRIILHNVKSDRYWK